VAASAAIIAEMTRQIAALEAQLVAHFDAHPDAERLGCGSYRNR